MKKSIHKSIFHFVIVAFSLFLFSACGEIVQTATDIGESIGAGLDTTPTVFVFATDFGSSGQLYQATYSDSFLDVSNTGVTELGSGAIIRYFDGLLYVLHDGWSYGSSDNVQIIHPDDSFATQAQYSTGNGTNPHDIVVSGSRAFISLYNPTADLDNIDAQGLPGDVIEMNLDTGEIVHRFSFHDYLNDDGDKNANADQMILHDGILYVCLQDLDSDYSATSSGLVGRIDISTGEVLGVITLSGRNPVDIALSEDQKNLFIANMATYDWNLGNYNTSEPFGGIEIVDLSSNSSTRLIDDEGLGGYVEKLTIWDNQILAVVSEYDNATFSYLSIITELSEDATSSSEATTFLDVNADFRDIFVQNDYLWVSKRLINTSSGAKDPLLSIYDLGSGEQLDVDVDLDVAGVSIAGH